MFSQLSVTVCLFTGGSASRGVASRGVYIQGGLHPVGWQISPSPPYRILQNMVDERAVRMLLECILVLILSLKSHGCDAPHQRCSLLSKNYLPVAHLRGGGVLPARTPPMVQNFSQFHAVFRKFCQNHRFATPLWRVGAPSYGESWIRPCLQCECSQEPNKEPFIMRYHLTQWSD